ncbi:TlyA family RNA methyltransferase [Flexibacterium corallicola]|uniref:TlyA family RNA methyltransferase n=1 Tax=Flexibacterium corallicola TaxID=3037259 RepID=UPI00286EBDF3|nr:TlyA family RNA methyltransferase [Pseudovibrio sp. M1P-2-3]
MRLDNHLVAKGAFETRARARDAIVRGTVQINGKTVTKPGQKVLSNSTISFDDPAAGYVSRAALKLKEGLNYFDLSPKDLICLDIGASTGGFTQVLLEHRAAKVHAIDVGHGQLHKKIIEDTRVYPRDGLNARHLCLEDLQNDTPQFLVSDVSFISLKIALPPALDLAASGAKGIFLIKPQFEAGRENINKGGLVGEEQAALVCKDLQSWFDALENWSVIGVCPSPIKGGDGNTEFLIAAQKI